MHNYEHNFSLLLAEMEFATLLRVDTRKVFVYVMLSGVLSDTFEPDVITCLVCCAIVVYLLEEVLVFARSLEKLNYKACNIAYYVHSVYRYISVAYGSSDVVYKVVI